MNNKGQVLVIFVVMLPIFLIILTLVVDLGLISFEKRNISNNTIDAVEYYLESNDEEKTKDLLEENIDDIVVTITDNNSYVEITVIKKCKGLYSIIKNEDIIEVTYKGIKEDKSIIKG